MDQDLENYSEDDEADIGPADHFPTESIEECDIVVDGRCLACGIAVTASTVGDRCIPIQ